MTFSVDQISLDQKRWLPHLVEAMRHAVGLSLPDFIYQTFSARGWIEGVQTAAILTGDGYTAALRILGDEVSRTTKPRKTK